MMNEEFMPTVTELLANATRILEDKGYGRVSIDVAESWKTSNVRLFEDDFGIVAVVVYDTWRDLSSKWVDAQAALVELLSKYTTRYDPKSWEGYLVLLTPSPVARENSIELTEIRYDISRVRKIVATGNEIRALDDVRQVLLPLLPIEVEIVSEVGESVLVILPELLSERGLPKKAVEIVIDAFLEQKPIVESLHKYRTGNRYVTEYEDKVD